MTQHTTTTFGWVQAMQGAWGAVPASELLQPGADAWSPLKLSPPDAAESASFALAGRALKYGKSVAIALPLMGGEGLTRLMVYLHRIRWDALQGGIRSPWLNPGNMETCPDIVFISRPRAGFNDLSRVPALRARVLRASDQKRNMKSASETLVVDGSLDVMELVEMIGRASKPFVLVVDGTRGGNDNAAALDSALSESFPEIPRITLLSLGDSESLDKIRSNGTLSHLWLMRLGDKSSLARDAKAATQFQLLVTEDRRANHELAQLADRFFALRRDLDRKDVVLKERLAIIGKVFRSLNELPVPLPFLESALQSATRPGLYPVRCLERWLQIAGNGSCLYGESDVASRNLIKQLTNVHELFSQSVTGKAGWLLKHLRASFSTKQNTLVLCGSPHEVAALESWFDNELDEGWNATVHITAMDGVKAYRQFRGAVDEVIITGMLWPSRQHWLATPCRRVVVPAYDYEKPFVERMLHQWWSKHGVQSCPDGDKLAQWQLAWTDRRYEDSVTQAQTLVLEAANVADCCTYPAKERQVSIPLAMEFDHWLELLMEEPVEPSTPLHSGDPLMPDLIWVTLEGTQSEIPWSKNRPVLVLRDDEIHPTVAEELTEGDQIILLRHNDERIATQEKLFDMVALSEGMQQFLRAAGRWKTMVDSVATRLTVKQVQAQLRKEKVEVCDATVGNWYRHKVYGPRDRAAVAVFARLSGAKNPERSALLIANAIEQVRIAHQQIGKQLRKAILERGKGATTIEIGELTLDAKTFDDMIEIGVVTSIRVTATHVMVEKEDGLVDIANEVIGAHPGRICLTKPAIRSMRDSVYRDHRKFRSCLKLMATRLYEHYNDKAERLHDVLKHFKQETIEFEPKMSPVTMGMYADKRLYKGKPADMNRHFCLGRARDPSRTLRIHFDWDAEEKLLVIHHAGKHLETTQS
ncbi:DISARM anti-phage system protein DrmE domain-containing protein [Pseudomonas sp. SDO524_S393]